MKLSSSRSPSAFLMLVCLSGFAQQPANTVVLGSAAQPASVPKLSNKPITPQERIAIIRDVNAETIQVKKPFPQGKEGLVLKGGVLGPSDQEIQQMVAAQGAAALPGQKAQITDILFKDHAVMVEINGGPVRKKKWYQRVSVAGRGGLAPVAPQSEKDANARGSVLEMQFDKFIPGMTSADFKKLLEPAFDFTPLPGTDSYLESLPPKVKAALKEHRVLVGMDRDMVVQSKGMPDQKIRERKDDVETEEWVYGAPPKDVEFVRFIGEEVVQDKIFKIGGETIVRTEREIDLTADTTAEAKKNPTEPPAKRPTLRRDGDEEPQLKTQLLP
jgi:hypothetical protein